MTKIRKGQISSAGAAVGQVLTATAGGNTDWEDGAGGSYRQFTYVPDGAGSFAFVVDGDGMPVFALLDTE